MKSTRASPGTSTALCNFERGAGRSPWRGIADRSTAAALNRRCRGYRAVKITVKNYSSVAAALNTRIRLTRTRRHNYSLSRADSRRIADCKVASSTKGLRQCVRITHVRICKRRNCCRNWRRKRRCWYNRWNRCWRWCLSKPRCHKTTGTNSASDTALINLDIHTSSTGR